MYHKHVTKSFRYSVAQHTRKTREEKKNPVISAQVKVISNIKETRQTQALANVHMYAASERYHWSLVSTI